MLIGINDRMGAGKVFIYSHFSSLTVQCQLFTKYYRRH